jgi:transcriptional regulator with XRE-family HTH domain
LSVLSPRDLKLLRRASGLSLSDVAGKVGCDASHVSRIERGERPLSPDLELKLLRIFWGRIPGASGDSQP